MKRQYRLYAWTGPLAVSLIAARLRESGVEVLAEGTERVIVRIEGEDALAAHLTIMDLVEQRHGQAYWWLRFVPVMCTDDWS